MSIHRAIFNAIKDEALNFNYNISQMEVLRYIAISKNPTMKDIAKHLDIKPPSVTTIVNFLTNDGLLKKEIDKDDNRITRIVPTVKAKKLFKRVKTKKVSAIDKMFSVLNNKDKSELIRILSKLNK